MDIFDTINRAGLEQLLFFREETVGLKAVIAIHSTLLGPAIGGIRMMDYPDQDSALHDANDLAREMALRAVLADCDLGGGSAILWGPSRIKSEAYFRALGRFINRFQGQFLAVMEVGIDSRDLRHIKRETNYVLALPEAYGGIANPTVVTAEGVLQGIKATAKFVFGSSSLENLTCLVQGVGRLGNAIVGHLVKAKAKIIVSDCNYDKIKTIQDQYPEVSMVRPEEVPEIKADLIIPCAWGNFVTPKNIDRFRCKAIAGGASNVLPDVETGDILAEKGILYTPHFVIDSGELIQAEFEFKGRSVALLGGAIGEIYNRTLNLLEKSREAKVTPIRTALQMANERLEKVANIGRRNTL